MKNKWMIVLILVFLFLVLVIATVINNHNRPKSKKSDSIDFQYYGPDAYAQYSVILPHDLVINKLNTNNNFTIISIIDMPRNTTKIEFNYTDSSVPMEELMWFTNYLTILGADNYLIIRIHYSTPFPIDGDIYSLEDEDFWENVTQQYIKDRGLLERYFYPMLEEIERMLDLPKPKSYDVRISELKR